MTTPHLPTGPLTLDEINKTLRDIIASLGISVGGSGSLTVSGNASISGTNTGDQDLSSLVVGPSSVTDGHLAVFDGITGKLIKDGGAVPSGNTLTKLSSGSKSSNFSLIVPMNNYVLASTFAETNGGTVIEALSFDVIAGNPLLGTEGIPITNPVGVINLTGEAGGQGNIPGVYSNGTLGVGATFTVDVGSMPLLYDDGNAVADGDRILFGGQTDATQNGIYTYVLATGVCTRATDYDQAAEILKGTYVWGNTLTTGSSNVYMVSTSPLIVGTDNIVFKKSVGINTGTVPISNSLATQSFPSPINGQSQDYKIVATSTSAGILPSWNTAVGTLVIYYAEYV